ncbi:MAG: hypothetical protein AAFU53_06375 [Cyanobacteria bacterium J06632_3]
MESHAATVNARLEDRLETVVTRTADNVSELTESIKAQSSNIERLERVIALIVAESTAQREIVNNLIKLATA